MLISVLIFDHPGDEGGVLWSDPEIGIDWPIPEGVEPILSEKDKKWLGIKGYLPILKLKKVIAG